MRKKLASRLTRLVHRAQAAREAEFAGHDEKWRWMREKFC